MEDKKNLLSADTSALSVDNVNSEDIVPKKEKIFYGMGAILDGGGVALRFLARNNGECGIVGILRSSQARRLRACKKGNYRTA